MLTRPMLFTATVDTIASLHFYRDLLGLRLLADTPFALVFDINGTTLRVQKVEQVVVAPYTSAGFEVTNLAATVAALSAKGVKFEQYPFLQQDIAGIWTTPDGAKVAWCKDPDGSIVSFTQNP